MFQRTFQNNYPKILTTRNRTQTRNPQNYMTIRKLLAEKGIANTKGITKVIVKNDELTKFLTSVTVFTKTSQLTVHKKVSDKRKLPKKG